jgi:hypothetical protein
VPEGFYFIDRFNPESSYHLSLGLNYPNPSDRIRSDHGRPGGDIFIHGSNQTIGCLPLGDEAIEELYLPPSMRGRGQRGIPCTSFPREWRVSWETLRGNTLPRWRCAGAFGTSFAPAMRYLNGPTAFLGSKSRVNGALFGLSSPRNETRRGPLRRTGVAPQRF